jgi:hypothetical protein
MRTGLVIAISLLLLAGLLMTFWFGTDLSPAFRANMNAPGQFPLETATQDVWPATVTTRAFAPSDTMGSNLTVSEGSVAPKVACAMGRGQCIY